MFQRDGGRPVNIRAKPSDVSDALTCVRDNVATLRRQGRPRDETTAAKPTAAFDAKRGQFVVDPGFFTRPVYRAFSRHDER